jgi:hypothetical protein
MRKQYIENVKSRLKSVRYAEFSAHSCLTSIEGYLAAGMALEALTFSEYYTLMGMAKNARAMREKELLA